MTRKQFTQILRKHYKEPMVKAVKSNVCRPAYDKMYQMNEEDGVNFKLWKDVRGWLRKQKRAELEAKRAKK
ncbi:hypothetical protein [Campylobacter showae]|uniref:hypothetical protein n=1 Tax=Campylobacter showae TaxID=204 RepID=UPI0028D33313|nr:hypothetical protein [Campylobacter showae]